jgi:hypothetical protein
MSAMQDFYIAPVSIDACVARAQAARSQDLARLLLGLPATLRRVILAICARTNSPSAPAGKAA